MCMISFLREMTSSFTDLLWTRWGVASSLLVTCLAKCAGRGWTKSDSRDVFTIPVWWKKSNFNSFHFNFFLLYFYLTDFTESKLVFFLVHPPFSFWRQLLFPIAHIKKLAWFRHSFLNSVDFSLVFASSLLWLFFVVAIQSKPEMAN